MLTIEQQTSTPDNQLRSNNPRNYGTNQNHAAIQEHSVDLENVLSNQDKESCWLDVSLIVTHTIQLYYATKRSDQSKIELIILISISLILQLFYVMIYVFYLRELVDCEKRSNGCIAKFCKVLKVTVTPALNAVIALIFYESSNSKHLTL